MSDPAASPKKKYLAAWVGASFFFLLIGAVWLAYWLFWGQFKEWTNDAYTNGNMILISPFHEGIVVAIHADNAQKVEKGQVLVELDRHAFEIALEKAKADLAEAVRDVVQMFFRVESLRARIQGCEARVVRARLDYEHRAELVSDGSVSREDYEHSETDLTAALAALTEAEKEWAEAVSQIQSTTPFNHPKVEMAKAAVKQAFLDLNRCSIRAPASGIIGKRIVQVGEWAGPRDSMMILVPLDELWVDANFREVEIEHIRIGQPVDLVSDMYGKGTVFRGRIAGLNPGTGQVFSILPPQNATGNWIKIIQRVPVKVNLNPADLQSHPLVLGLSMEVTVDTHDRSGKRLPEAGADLPLYRTDVYAGELDGADELIEEILSQNCSCEVYRAAARGINPS